MGPPKFNQPSLLLSQEENEMVFGLLGSRCQTMSSAVVQLFTTSPPDHSTWNKVITGVACFERDSEKRSYFLRVYCLLSHELGWEEQIRRWTNVEKPREFLISFQGKNCMISLNFASEDEATIFHTTMVETITNHAVKKRASIHGGAAIGTGHQQIDGMTESNESRVIKKSRANEKRERRKLTKNDISLPTNFTHVAHVGWNGSHQIDSDTQSVDKVSVNAKLAKQTKTSTLPLKSAPKISPKDGLNRKPLSRAPPVPSKQNQSLSPAPPPPPPTGGPPPPPPPPPMLPPLADKNSSSIVSNTRSTANQNSNALTSNATVPLQTDPHAELMEAIRNRNANVLRKVNKENAECDTPKSKNSTVEKPVDELEKALRDRIVRVNLSDSEDDEYSSDSDEWDD